MKTNDYLLIGGVAAYSFLFHEQNAGINFPIFTMVAILILLIRNQNLLFSLKWNWAAAMALLSSVCIVIHSSALSVFANIFSLLLLSAFSFNTTTSSIFSFGFSVYSIFSSFVFVILEAIRRSQEPSKETEEKSYRWLGIIIVTIIALLFFMLYKNSNPIFAEYTKWINLDFLTVTWFFFTGIGFFFMYAFLYHRTIEPIERWENNLATKIHPSGQSLNSKRLDTERVSLITLFTLLNLMLLVINIGDVNTILLEGALPKGVKHSDFVHNGVGALIFSIIFAISIIMYFLRGQLNFYKGSRFFKLLVLVWIVQNLLMLLSTCFRNHLYITEYTLTYKRIGVYVWLGLAMLGLIITAIKIQFNKTNWYLVKTNFAIWFTAFALSSVVDWDLLITRYNLQHKNINEVDYHYLFDLSETNIPEMLEFCKKKAAAETKPIEKIDYGRAYYHYGPDFDYLNLIRYKIESYLLNYKSDWRSWDLRDERIMKALNNK